MFSNQNRNRGGATSVRTPLSLKGGAIPKLRTEFKKSMEGLKDVTDELFRRNNERLQELEDLLKKDTISKNDFQKFFGNAGSTATNLCYENIVSNINTRLVNDIFKDVQKYAQKIDKELEEIAEEFDL